MPEKKIYKLFARIDEKTHSEIISQAIDEDEGSLARTVRRLLKLGIKNSMVTKTDTK